MIATQTRSGFEGETEVILSYSLGKGKEKDDV